VVLVIKMEVKSKTVGFRLVAGVAIAAIIIAAVFASGIQLPTSTDNPDQGVYSDMGHLTVLLKDAPADVDELWIKISDLAVHRIGDDDTEGGWIPVKFSEVEGSTLIFDLLTYQNGKTLELSDVDLEVGNYSKIRMTVLEANATYYGEEENQKVPLKVPSGHIDVITKFNITATEDVVVVIDMIPDMVKISHSNNLNPTLKAEIYQSSPAKNEDPQTNTQETEGDD
jgi:hypothetical protein